MKIVWVTRGFPYPPDAGDRIVVYNWLSRLSDRGHEIHLLASVPEKPKTESVNKLSEIIESLEWFESSGNIYKYVKSYLQPRKPFIIQLSRVEKIEKMIEKHTKEEDVDTVFFDHTHVSGYSPSEEIKSFLGVHNLEYKWYWNTTKLAFPSVESLAYAVETIRMFLYEKRMFQKDKYSIYEFVSKSELEWTENHFPDLSDQIRWSPIGIDVNRFNNIDSAPLTQDQPTIVFTGTMKSRLNTDAVSWFADEIFPKVKSEVPDAKFIIVGKDPSDEVLQLSEIDDVVVTGAVDDVEPYIVGADLVVVPLRGGAGVKIKLLEGLAANNLVLTTKYGIQGTSITPGKEVLYTNKEDEFAYLATDCLRNPQKYKHIRDNGYEYILQNHSWETIIDKLEDEMRGN